MKTKKLVRFFAIYFSSVIGTWGLLEAPAFFTGTTIKDALGIFWWVVMYVLPLIVTVIITWKTKPDTAEVVHQSKPPIQIESEPVHLSPYLSALAEECSHLPLGTIASEFMTKSHEDRVALEAVYVRLDVHNADRMDSDMDARAWALRLAVGDLKDRRPLLEAITDSENRFHVILGEAGSGKTTFINYLTSLLATRDQDLPERIQGLLPFHLILREVAAKHIPADAEKGNAQMLWNALLDNISSHLGNDAGKTLLNYLQTRMINEGAVVLLDGLDEVPEAMSRRRILLEAIRDLVSVLNHQRSRFLITARPYAYVDPKWRLKNFTSWSLAPFDENQKLEFINRWYVVIRSLFGWSDETARTKGERLLYALKDRPYLGELAGRPLFLTLMAAIHSTRGQLPEDRAELFEETIRLLLSRWQRARDVKGPDGKMMIEPGLTEALRVDERRIRSSLETLAYNSHKKQRTTPRAQEGPADISRSEIREAFEPLLDDVKLSILLKYLGNRAGLLLERKDGVFAFPHRSLQEYLTACHFAEEPDFPDELIDYVEADYEWWKEIFLLAVGKSRRGGLNNALFVVSNLVPEGPNEISRCVDKDWRNAVLAAEAILELGLLRQTLEGRPTYQALIRRIKVWLRKILDEERLSPIERLSAGDSLGYLRDSRPGVGLMPLNKKDIPDIDWILVPAGPFIMGSADDDENAEDNERPSHRLSLPNYYISRYPITNEQFRPFITAKGYTTRRYWNDVGWSWVQGGPPDFTSVDDEKLRKRYEKWMAGRPSVKEAPQWWGDSFWAAPTRPVIGVNWYEALAYAAWLNEVYLDPSNRIVKLYPESLDNRSFRVRLPSEAEWEKAARGVDGRLWPWGNESCKGVTNTSEEGLGTTSPVGIFPRGRSPFSVMDMTGNVWEWTRSRWGNDFRKPDYLYPYDPTDGREDETGTQIRSVRGSSWYGDIPNYGRCAYRGWGFSFNASRFSGFRLVIALTDVEP